MSNPETDESSIQTATMCGDNNCHSRSFDGSIRMFTSMTILFIFQFLLSTVSGKCTSLTPTKKMIINFVVSTLGIFMFITVYYSGVIPNTKLKEKRDLHGDFYKCSAEEKEGYVTNGVYWFSGSRPYYLHENIQASSTAEPDLKSGIDDETVHVGWDPKLSDSTLRDEERHFYHLLFSFFVGSLISAGASIKYLTGRV